jgi:anaerobic ribonucleoside-triphosphate reductase activating protein
MSVPGSLTLRMHGFLENSLSNGPGRRAVLWVQGCTLGCPGCFNPETHPSILGNSAPVEDIFHRIQSLAGSIEGVTISGGEPLQQRRPLEALLQQIHTQTTLSVILFTGYSWIEVNQMPRIQSLLNHVDVLLAGRYLQNFHLGKTLLGSSNKTIHFLSERYTLADMEQIPSTEILLDLNGEIILSGIDPLQWNSQNRTSKET